MIKEPRRVQYIVSRDPEELKAQCGPDIRPCNYFPRQMGRLKTQGGGATRWCPLGMLKQQLHGGQEELDP